MSAMMISFASPVDTDSEPSWREWSTQVHIAEIRQAIPEITSVSQHRVMRARGARPRFATIYEAPTLSSAELAAKLHAAGSSFSPSPSHKEGDDAPQFHFIDLIQD